MMMPTVAVSAVVFFCVFLLLGQINQISAESTVDPVTNLTIDGKLISFKEQFSSVGSYPDSFDLGFTISEDYYSLHLVRNPNVWSEGLLTLEHADGTFTSMAPPDVYYRSGNNDKSIWASATVYDEGIHLLMHNTTSGEILEINPVSHALRHLTAEEAASIEGHHTVAMAPTMGQSYRPPRLSRRAPTADINTNAVGIAPMFNNCYSQQSTQYVAKVAFYLPYLAVTNLENSTKVTTPYNTLAYIGSILADSNVVYANQLNIALRVHTNGTKIMLYSNGTPGKADVSWNYNSTRCSSYNSEALDAIKSYGVAQTSDASIATHVILNPCSSKDGYSGVGYTSGLCDQAWNYAVVVMGSSGSTWLLFAHEVGHNFNGSHAFQEGQGKTGGIMDYTDGRYPIGKGYYGFHPKYNKDEVCSKIKSLLSYNTKCIVPASTSTPTCGDGIVEGDEDCDPGPGRTSPCCTSKCKFASKAQCDYIQNSCCTSNCTYALPSSCGYQSYCSNGRCLLSSCSSYSNTGFCSQNTCTYGCYYNSDKSTCKSGGKTGWNYTDKGYIADESYCGDGKYCISGSCISNTLKANVCGNGVVEDGEECDGGTCCSSTCKFIGQCDYDKNPSCCTKNCTYSPPSTSCGYQSYCSNGTCTGSSCNTYSNLGYCSTGSCTYGCYYNSDTSYCKSAGSGGFNFADGGKIPDGIYCDVGKNCLSGKCVLNTLKANQCGNGIIEAGEDCDPGPGNTSPCCSSTCKFVKQCDYNDNASCCTKNCTYSLPSTSCGYQSYCKSGKCTTSSCSTYSNLGYCSTGACTYGCYYNSDTSYCRSAGSSGFNFADKGLIPNGTYCAEGKNCTAGKCV